MALRSRVEALRREKEDLDEQLITRLFTKPDPKAEAVLQAKADDVSRQLSDLSAQLARVTELHEAAVRAAAAQEFEQHLTSRRPVWADWHDAVTNLRAGIAAVARQAAEVARLSQLDRERWWAQTRASELGEMRVHIAPPVDAIDVERIERGLVELDQAVAQARREEQIQV